MAAAVVARSEEHTSELQSHSEISYAVFCLKKKKPTRRTTELVETTIRRPNVYASSNGAVNLAHGSPYILPSSVVFFFNDTATTEIYTLSYTLSLHDALPI